MHFKIHNIVSTHSHPPPLDPTLLCLCWPSLCWVWNQRQILGVDTGPPEWDLHRIIVFFLYSSSLLCSEPTHVFGRTRWLTLANGNQKTRVRVTWLLHTPGVEGLHPAPRKLAFPLETTPLCQKTWIQPGWPEVRLSSQAAALVEWKGLRSGWGEKHQPLQRWCNPVVKSLDFRVCWIWVQIYCVTYKLLDNK